MIPIRRLVVGVGLAIVVVLAAVAGPSPVRAQDRRPADFDYVAHLDELTDSHARVLRLYWTAFDRPPDAAGALYWIDQVERCRSLHHIAAFFAASPEFTTTYGALDDDGFVAVLYRNVLDREPDTAGRRYWVDRLTSGSVTRIRMMLDFSFSPEFVADHRLPSDGVPGRPCRGPVPSGGARTQSFSVQDWLPYAMVGPVTLHLPASAVALVGFHQSTHDGAQAMTALTVDVPMRTMADRNRDTDRRGAADLPVHPLAEIRSPVSGTVLRAGGYVLYCRYTDDFAVIEPDDRPGWEVKVLHLRGVAVQAGDRVEAGVTVLAAGATVFPFRSQVDAFTAEPSWGHVHLEVVDPSIPDRPSSGPGCS